jgi:hypothetical protein
VPGNNKNLRLATETSCNNAVNRFNSSAEGSTYCLMCVMMDFSMSKGRYSVAISNPTITEKASENSQSKAFQPVVKPLQNGNNSEEKKP